MSRRKAAPKRAILPDPLFQSELLAKFMNVVMRNGKKSVAEKVVYGALDNVAKKLMPGSKAAKSSDEEGGSGEKGGGSSGKGTKSGAVAKSIWNNEAAREKAIETFKAALENITPTVEVRSRRVGGSTYQVPVEIHATRKVALAMRWLREYASKRNEKTMIMRLANEILDALEERGGAVKKREDVHRMAKANQAFEHYKW